MFNFLIQFYKCIKYKYDLYLMNNEMNNEMNPYRKINQYI